MAQSAEQSELLALLRKKSQGSYEKVRDAEARPGGRSLPAKLKKAYARATSLKLARDKNDNLYAYLYANCVEPKDYAGLHAGVMFPLSESQWRSFEQCLDQFMSALKLLGFTEKIERAGESDFFSSVLPGIMEWIEKDKPYFEFHTSNKEKEDGSVNVFVDGLPPQGYEPPDRDENKHRQEGYEDKASPPAKTKSPPGKKEEPAAKSPPKGKSPPKSPPKAPFTAGDAVDVVGDFFGDGAADGDYTGKVVSVDTKQAQCTVRFEGASDNYEIPFVNLVAAKASEEDNPVGKKVNSSPNYFGNGVSYSGEVIAYDSESGKYTVRFDDDGQELEMTAEELVF